MALILEIQFLALVAVGVHGVMDDDVEPRPNAFCLKRLVVGKQVMLGVCVDCGHIVAPRSESAGEVER